MEQETCDWWCDICQYNNGGTCEKNFKKGEGK